MTDMDYQASLIHRFLWVGGLGGAGWRDEDSRIILHQLTKGVRERKAQGRRVCQWKDVWINAGGETEVDQHGEKG